MYDCESFSAARCEKRLNGMFAWDLRTSRRRSLNRFSGQFCALSVNRSPAIIPRADR